MKHRLLLGILCIASLSGILVAGLWPFHAPRNEVTWLKDHNGLRFGDYGTVMSTSALNRTGLPDNGSCSVELWLRAAGADNGGTILSFYAPNQPLRLSLHQSLSDLMLRSRRPNSPGRVRRQRIYINDVFRQGQPVFLTITSGSRGTTVYVNGTLARDTRFRIVPSDCTGRLIVGDSTQRPDTWSGEVRGLAIYYNELTASTVLQHYHAWTQKGQLEAGENEHLVGLYLFDERTGNIVHNHAGMGADLFIPGTYTVLDKAFLRPDWDQFSMHGGYWLNNLKNVVGFVPLGLCFCAYLALIRKTKRPGLVTIILGFAVSLTIEVLQGYLPTRDSGTTDLITNTLGTWIGVLLYNAAKARWNCTTRHLSEIARTFSEGLEWE